jgi:hypothetical protein
MYGSINRLSISSVRALKKPFGLSISQTWVTMTLPWMIWYHTQPDPIIVQWLQWKQLAKNEPIHEFINPWYNSILFNNYATNTFLVPSSFAGLAKAGNSSGTGRTVVNDFWLHEFINIMQHVRINLYKFEVVKLKVGSSRYSVQLNGNEASNQGDLRETSLRETERSVTESSKWCTTITGTSLS